MSSFVIRYSFRLIGVGNWIPCNEIGKRDVSSRRVNGIESSLERHGGEKLLPLSMICRMRALFRSVSQIGGRLTIGYLLIRDT